MRYLCLELAWYNRAKNLCKMNCPKMSLTKNYAKSIVQRRAIQKIMQNQLSKDEPYKKLCKIDCPKTSHTKNYAKSRIKEYFKTSSHKNYQMRSKQISNKKSGLVVTEPVIVGEKWYQVERTGLIVVGPVSGSSVPACYRSCSCAAPAHTRDAAPCTV
jgi:hypothetical protein